MSTEQVNIYTHIAEGNDMTLTHLKGDAPKPIELRSYSATGNLEAPKKFYEKNTDYVKKFDSVVSVDQKNNSIILVIGYNHPHMRTIKGTLLLDPDFESLGINKNVTYTRTELAKKLKFLRRYFTQPSVCMDLVDRFKKLEIQFTNRLEQMDDGRGNKRELLDQVINENTIPESFDLTMPMALGGKPHQFSIDIGIDIVGGKHVQFWLESVLVKDMLQDQAADMLNKSVADFEKDKNLPVIYV